tara:strand:- start:29 stop:475 length:447 start_codon:yes stop_codon:yes gene_type:complete
VHFYNQLKQSGFLSEAKGEFKAAQGVDIDSQLPHINDNLEDVDYTDMWSFNVNIKDEIFSDIMDSIEGYDIIAEEYLQNIDDEIFAIKGIGFSLFCSIRLEDVEEVKQKTLLVTGSTPYYSTTCFIDSKDIYILLYIDYLDLPRLHLN